MEVVYFTLCTCLQLFQRNDLRQILYFAISVKLAENGFKIIFIFFMYIKTSPSFSNFLL